MKPDSDIASVTSPDSPSKFAGTDAADELRGVRRIFLVALAAALLAAAVAFVVELANVDDNAESGPTVAALPLVFHQPGFVEHEVHRVGAVQLPASTRRGVLRLPGGGPVYIVARCDTGQVRATLGALSTAQVCRGTPMGVVVLNQVRRRSPLDLTVSASQRGPWTVAVYR